MSLKCEKKINPRDIFRRFSREKKISNKSIFKNATSVTLKKCNFYLKLAGQENVKMRNHKGVQGNSGGDAHMFIIMTVVVSAMYTCQNVSYCAL